MDSTRFAANPVRVMERGESRISTREDIRDGVYGLEVRWIAWDSGFRGSGLRVGDRVIGDGGGFYDAEVAKKQGVIGGAGGEDRRIQALGLGAGSPLLLWVVRDGQQVAITGTLRGPQLYRRNGKPVLGMEGPEEFERGPFTTQWGQWYRGFVELAMAILPGWDYISGFDSRQYLVRARENEARVLHAEAEYPGPWAQAVREDYDAMVRIAAGEVRDLPASALEYRALGEARAQRITAAGKEALAALRAALGDKLTAAPARAPHPFKDGMEGLVGKTFEFPQVTDRDVLVESRRGWFVLGPMSSPFLVERAAPELRPMFEATDKYIERVHPQLRKRRFLLIGEIEPQPALVSDPDRRVTVVGPKVRPLAVEITDDENRDKSFFVDLRPEHNPERTFAGAEALLLMPRAQLRDDLGPGVVMQVFVEALKLGDFDTWRACFAPWRVRPWFRDDQRHLVIDLSWPVMSNDQTAASTWDRSRRFLLEDVYAVEVARVESPPRVVFADETRRVEEVEVGLVHVGRFDGEYRTFTASKLHRRWRLQRLDGGPWRVTEEQGL